MMNKILLFLVVPLTIVGIFIFVKAVSADEIDYEILYGNLLNDVQFESNTYVEIKDKEVEIYDEAIPESFTLVAEDSDIELYLEEETLAIAVRVKANGYVYSSYNFNDSFGGDSVAITNPIKSGVSIGLYKESTPIAQSYLDERSVYEDGIYVGEERVASSRIRYNSNGFIAEVDFSHPELMIKFDVHVSIVDGNLVVNVPRESVEEYNPNIWRSDEQYFILRNLVLFPYFGSTVSETDGYVFIPDGAGALISLEASPAVKASFELNVYGEDLGYLSPTVISRALGVKPVSRVTMPVYGVVHDVGNTGFFVISESGANYSQIKFKSTGLINDYYNIYFSYKYRESYEQYQSRANEDQYRISFQDDPNEYDLSQRYIFLSGSEADYVGMAKTYQSYLIDNGLLGEERRTEYDKTPTKVDFIGSEITTGILSNKAQTVTTYEEITEILTTMKDDGYSNLIASLKTYNMSEDSYRFDIIRKLGGSKEFEKMLNFFDDNNIEFSYYSDYVRNYEIYSKSHAQTLSKREIYFVELSWMFFAHFVTSPSYYEQFAKRCPNGTLLQQMIFIELQLRLPELLLMRADKMSMANSLEIRVPFLDRDIMDFAMRVPDVYKLRNAVSKEPIKKLAACYAGRKDIYRPKTGFGVPIQQWFKGQLGDALMDLLEADQANLGQLFNRDAINYHLKHGLRTVNEAFQLWVIYNMLVWQSGLNN